MGKTFEATRLRELERASGRDVRWYPLAFAGDQTTLRAKLQEFLQTTGTETSIYLDALDESTISAELAAQELTGWLDELSARGARVRLTCRTTVWPTVLRDKLDNYHLQQLSDADIEAAAQQCGLDAGLAMRDQLVERYIPQLGASDGVYVVVWMDVPDRADLEEWHNPNWESLETARAELEDQAAELGGEHLNLRALVLDASLR